MKLKITALILSIALCVGLAACGSSDDWRDSGEIVGSGTITHTGEGSVPVLVTISPESAAFYRDQPEQILFDSVSFPMEIPDAVESFSQISFDDINGDNESDVTVSFIHENGDMTDLVWLWEGTTFRYVFDDELSRKTINVDLSDYVGLWQYVDNELWLRIYDDSTWEFLDVNEDVIYKGTLWADESGITLHFDENGDTLKLDFTTSGDLIDSANLGTLVRVEAIEPGVAYFAENDIKFNAATNNGTYLLENGVAFYADQAGSGYYTSDCYWEVVKNSDETHDGIREIQFDAICYVPESSAIYDVKNCNTAVESALYDYYTGTWLTESTEYDNSTRGEIYYLHTVNYKDKSYTIEFYCGNEWQYNVDDWAIVLTKSYMVYLPADYDGLVFAAETEPDNFKDFSKLLVLDTISPEAKLLDIELVDAKEARFFDICA